MLFLYCSCHEDKRLSFLWSEECLMDSCFGLLCWLRLFTCLFCNLWSNSRSFFFFASKEANRFPSCFWMQDMSLIPLILTSTQEISVLLFLFVCWWLVKIRLIFEDIYIYIYIYREREFSWLTPDTNQTLQFGRSKLSVQVDGRIQTQTYNPWSLNISDSRIFFDFVQTHTISGPLSSLTVEYLLTSHTRDIPLQLKNFNLNFHTV